MPDKRLAEFNYKLLNNILCNKAFLSKLKQDTHSQCNICLINESSKHLIFECKNVTEIWNALGTFLKTNIKWKHVIVGFNYESNRKVITLNTLISYVAYRIYKYKMYCSLQCLDETNYNILHHVKSSIVFYATILKNIKSAINYKLFENFVHSIEY